MYLFHWKDSVTGERERENASSTGSLLKWPQLLELDPSEARSFLLVSHAFPSHKQWGRSEKRQLGLKPTSICDASEAGRGSACLAPILLLLRKHKKVYFSVQVSSILKCWNAILPVGAWQCDRNIDNLTKTLVKWTGKSPISGFLKK